MSACFKSKVVNGLVCSSRHLSYAVKLLVEEIGGSANYVGVQVHQELLGLLGTCSLLDELP